MMSQKKASIIAVGKKICQVLKGKSCFPEHAHPQQGMCPR